MKLRHKLVLLVISLVVVMSGALFTLSKYFLSSGFSKIEDIDTQNKTRIAVDAIKSMEMSIVSKAADWGVWDDAYEYVQRKNKNFEDSNFAAKALPNLKIDALAFFDEQNLSIKKIGYNLELDQPEPFNSDLSFHLNPSSTLFIHSNFEDEKHGIIMTEQGPFLFVSRPVVNSDANKPIKGTVFFARRLSPKQIETISKQTQLKVDFESWARSKNNSFFKNAIALLKQENKVYSAVQNENLIEGFTTLFDYKNQPALILRIQTNRNIYAVGQSSLNAMVLSIGFACLFFGFAFVFSLEKTVIRRMLNMTDRINDIKNDLKIRLNISGQDEVAVLGNEVNTMLDQIEKAQEDLRSANETISTMLNSVQQGFFIFNSNGLIEKNSSLACRTHLEQNPSGLFLWQVLKQNPEDCLFWLEQLFQETIAFESLAELGIKSYTNSCGSTVIIDYYPVRNNNGQLTHVVALATDITSELKAKNETKKQKQYVERIIRIVKNKNEYIQFINESRQIFKTCLFEAEQSTPDLTKILNLIHTLKGSSGVFSLNEVHEQSHEFESVLLTKKNINSNLSTDCNLNVVTKNNEFNSIQSQILIHRIHELSRLFENSISNDKDLIGTAIIDNLDNKKDRLLEVSYKNVKDFYNKQISSNVDQCLTTQFLDLFAKDSIANSFGFYPEAAQTLAIRLGKLIKPLKITGDSIKVIQEVYSDLFANMIHGLRNALDHGIESPEVREQKGKTPEGSLELKFENFSLGTTEWLRIRLIDDGKGIDHQRIKAKLITRGFSEEKIDQMTAEKLNECLFLPEFSTTETANLISGRGVGLYSIKQSSEKLGGQCFIHSTANIGSELIIEVPMISELPLTNEFETKI